jgi:hypothetical protein
MCVDLRGWWHTGRRLCHLVSRLLRAERHGSERRVVSEVEVDAAVENAFTSELCPTASSHFVALVVALPGQLNPQPVADRAFPIVN